MSEKSPEEIIQAHIHEKCDLLQNHPVTVDGHINGERALTNDYMGRALYELLQNAVDRADKNIWITLNEQTRTLTVANDGSPLGLECKPGEELSDFESLCSLHTSNKHPGVSIGNKGVGFKSIWEFCQSVQVRSRYGDKQTPWGFRLRFPFQHEHLEGWTDQETAGAIASTLANSKLQKKNAGKAPSFYFPEYLNDPDWHHQGAVTAIELEDVKDNDFKKLTKLVDEIADSPLMFVGDIRPDRRLTLQIKKPGQDHLPKKLFVDDEEWIRLTPDLRDLEVDLRSAMAVLSFELEDGYGKPRAPRVSMIFPKKDRPDFSGLMHSYLPTEVRVHARMHIQGDFYLSESRKHIEFDKNEYNKTLLNQITDTLLDAIAKNQGGLAGKPYALKLLSTTGPLGTLVKDRLEGDGKRLGDLFLSVLENTTNNYRTVDFYQEFFYQISCFMPPKQRYQRHQDHEKMTLKPYLEAFCRDNLPIVPVEYETSDDEDTPQLVHKACSLPLIRDEDSASKMLFCRRQDASDSLDPIDLPGVVITPWQFSPTDIASAMRKLHIWRNYEQAPLLRAIVRAQNKAVSNDGRSQLLMAALKVTASENERHQTHWRFVDKDEIHPSARLLVPVEGESGWAEARYSYIPDNQGLLDRHVNKELIRRLDHNRCCELLGNHYRNKLLAIGVWDCVPLVQNKPQRVWTMALSRLPSEPGSLALLARSYWIWNEAEGQNISPAIKTLTTSRWLTVDSGSTEPVAPASTFLGVSTGQALGYFLLTPDGLNDRERDFLRDLDIRRLDETTDIDKLIDVTKILIARSHGGKSLRPITLKTYRTIVRRINGLLRRDDLADFDQKLDELPLLYEDKKHDRGVASAGETIWFVPSSQNKAKAKLATTDAKWWLANGDIGTLANRLTQVSTLYSRQRLEIYGPQTSDSDCYQWLEQTYLPMFLALATYGDIGNIPNADEDTIQVRWQGLSVRRIEDATLTESVKDMDSETVSNVKETGLLWESVSLERAKSLKLYIAHDFSIDTEEARQHLCQWFAEEVFRQRGLTIYFQGLISRKDITDFGVSDSDLKETGQLISGWLPNHELDQLLDALRPLIGNQLTRNNWRNPSFYQNCGQRFDELQALLPVQLKPLIECLNPEHHNLDHFSHYLEDHRDQVASLPEEVRRKTDAWSELLSEDQSRFAFNFLPEDWLVQVSGISQEEFTSLVGKLTAEEEDLIAEQEANSSPITSIPGKANISTDSNTGQPLNAESLVEVQDDKERAAKDASNSKSGKNVEQRVAIKAAMKANALDSKGAERFFNLVSSEYKRLGKFDEMPSNRPSTERGWLKLLHIGGRWDAAAYDVIDYAATEDKLLLVEVKSSRFKPPKIHFSEPERRHFLVLNSNQFKDEFPDRRWRLYLATPDRYIDITDDFVSILAQHSEQFDSVDRNPAPEAWILRDIKVEIS